MKKSISIFLIMAIFCGFSACSEKNENTNITSTFSERSTAISQEDNSETLNSETSTSAISTVSKTEKSTSLNSSEVNNKASSMPEETTKIVTIANTTKENKSDNMEQITCTVEITCKSVLSNMDKLSQAKQVFIPQTGVILKRTTVHLIKGSNVFDALKKACSDNKCTSSCKFCSSGIQLEYSYTAGFSSYYVEGIHQLYEKDCGTKSGWYYSVNEVFPSIGCSSYNLKNGDAVSWIYSCDLGEDIGA